MDGNGAVAGCCQNSNLSDGKLAWIIVEIKIKCILSLLNTYWVSIVGCTILYFMFILLLVEGFP